MWFRRTRVRNKDDTIRAEAPGEIVQATVTNVIEEGPRGPFFVAVSDQLSGSITCSLAQLENNETPVWQDTRRPVPGDVVVLNVTMKHAGWRAVTGRLFRPSDQQTETSKQQTEMRKR